MYFFKEKELDVFIDDILLSKSIKWQALKIHNINKYKQKSLENITFYFTSICNDNTNYGYYS